MAKTVKVRTSLGQWEDLAINVPSANDPTFTGTTSSSQFSATQSVGDEGGEIKFAKAATNTTLNTGVTLDVYQDRVRLFETGGTNRGGYFDMSTLSTGVGTNLASGLTHINTTTFSASSAVNINNCFSSTYQNYRITFQLSASSTTSVTSLQLTSSGTASTSGWYYGQLGLTTGGSTSNTSGGNQSSLFLMDQISAEANTDGFTMDVLDPNNAIPTKVFHQAFFVNSTPVGIVRFGTAQHATASAYDGIKILCSTGTFTGTVRVYGYRNS